MSKKVTTKSSTIAALLAAGIEPTLEAWLAFNEATDTFDAELLDILPVEFHSDYEDRLRLKAEYEAKFADSRQQSHIVELKHGEA
jgi:hypothetical protein